jgi:AhpD family alkylhydroperoxidase
VVWEGWHREVSPYPDYLRVSQINNCAYCLDTHTRDLLRKGQSVEKLALVQAW